MKHLISTLFIYALITIATTLPCSAKQDQPHEADQELPGQKVALGFTIDLLPIALSASTGKFGASGQVWIGLDQLRLRLVGAKIHQPDWLAGKDDFHSQHTAVTAFIIDYVFGENLDQWWLGTGFEVWLNSISHEETGDAQARWANLV